MTDLPAWIEAAANEIANGWEGYRNPGQSRTEAVLEILLRHYRAAQTVGTELDSGMMVNGRRAVVYQLAATQMWAIRSEGRYDLQRNGEWRDIHDCSSPLALDPPWLSRAEAEAFLQSVRDPEYGKPLTEMERNELYRLRDITDDFEAWKNTMLAYFKEAGVEGETFAHRMSLLVAGYRRVASLESQLARSEGAVMSGERKHPMQAIRIMKDRVARFEENGIVRFLLDWATPRGMSLNELAIMKFDQKDREQFAQLIGYSVGGFGELSYVSEKTIAEADAIVEKLLRTAPKKPRNS